MLSNRVGLAIVGAACVMAAGTGAFIATRRDAPANPPAAVAAAAQGQAAGTAPAAVQETETVMDDEAKAPAATDPAHVTTPAAVPPVESQAPVAAPSVPKAPVAARETPSKPAKTSSASRQPARMPQPPVETRSGTSSSPAREPVRRTSNNQAPAPDPRGQAPAAEPVDPLLAPEMARRDPEPVRAPEPRFEEVVIPSDSVIGLQIDSSVSSETARVEDRVDARVTRDVTVHGRVAVPAGAKVRGAVTLVERGGKMRDRARLGVRFHTLVLADGTTLPIQTDTIFREGNSPATASSAKIGGAAIGGALLGAILGGTRGAVIGGTTGAAGGTAAVMAGGRRPATLSAGSTMTVRVLSPVPVTVERE